MNLAFLISLISIAVIDAINPSAIFMTFVLLGQKQSQIAKSLVYVFGIFVTYFCIGIILLLVYRFFGNSFRIDFSWIQNLFNKPPDWFYVMEFIVGFLILIYAIFFYKKSYSKPKETDNTKPVNTNTLLSVLLLGVTITFAELPTALPYFGGISTIYIANFSLFVSLGFLALYNLIFVLPPIVIILIYYFNRLNFDQITKKIRVVLNKYNYLLFKIGFILLAIFLIYNSLSIF